MDFSAVLQELHFVHKLIDQIDSATVITVNVLSLNRTWNARGVKSFAGISHHNQNLLLFVKVRPDWRESQNFVQELDWRRELARLAGSEKT